MGYISHHSILVTSWNKSLLRKAKKFALQIFPKQMVSGYVQGVTNEQYSFFIGPDGSKEGWETSDAYDDRREAFVRSLKTLAYEDGSNAVNYAIVRYGDDNGYARIEKHN